MDQIFKTSSQCINSEEMNMEIQTAIKYSYISSGHLDAVCDLLHKKKAFYDEYLEKQILPIDCWTRNDIIEFLKQKSSRGIIVERLTPFCEQGNNETEWINVLCGFVLYETQNQKFYIHCIVGEDIASYEKMITVIIDKGIAASKEQILVDVEEDDFGLMKILSGFAFKPKLIRQKKKDYYEFSLTLNQR